MPKQNTVTIEVRCPDCGGTGVYHGFAEPEGVGVVCLGCGGSGAKKLTYTPFTGRERRNGIKVVRRSRGTFIATGVGPNGSSVTYEEFLNGKMPK